MSVVSNTTFYLFNVKKNSAYIVFVTQNGTTQQYGPIHNWFNHPLLFNVTTPSGPYQIRFVDLADTTITGINPQKDKEKIVVFPNPSDGTIFIPLQFPGKLTIYDVSGSYVLSKDLGETLNIISLQIPNGVYFYKIFTNNNVYRGKITISK